MKILLACSGLVAAARAVAVRGVNLGGWLVLERYIRPSIMEVGFGPDVFPDDVDGQGYPVDQWTYATLSNSLGGKNATRERLTPHWDTWVTEDDIVTLRRAGITHVRVPIGHWILGDIADDEPYVDGEWWYLARAARWCQAHGMQIWLDLHTAPGSQNGFDNSGHLMPVVQDPITHRVISGTPPQWSLHPENVARTKRILQAIIDEVAADDALRATVTGFGPLNEPFAFTKPSVLKEYYDAALAIIRGGLGDEVTVYIGDMFNSTVFNNYWREPADGAYVDAENVLLDSHIYHCFFPAWRRYTGWMHIHSVCSERDEGRPRPPGTQIHDIDNIAQCCNAPPGDPDGAPNLGRLVGEWTLAFDQAPSPELEGYTAEHPHRNAGRHMSDAKRTFLRDFAEAQMVTYEREAPQPSIAGWFFWNFKMELDTYIEWSYLHGVRGGWIPTLDPALTAEEQFGTCIEIRDRQTNDSTIVDEYPYWEGADPHTAPVPHRGNASAAAAAGPAAAARKGGATVTVALVAGGALVVAAAIVARRPNAAAGGGGGGGTYTKIPDTTPTYGEVSVQPASTGWSFHGGAAAGTSLQ